MRLALTRNKEISSVALTAVVMLHTLLLGNKLSVLAIPRKRLAFRPNHMISRVARASDANVPTFMGTLLVGCNLTVGTVTSVQIAFVCQRVEMAPCVVA